MTEAAAKIRRLKDLDFDGKRVLVRVDYNVPLKGGEVVEDTRIRETLPTLRRLLERGARVVLIAHLGRPNGRRVEALSLAPAAPALSKLLGREVAFARDCIGPEADKAVAALKPGTAVLLENLRFHPGEESNDPAFAEALAKHGTVFVQEAFGALHRAHASTAGLPALLPSAAGLLVERELDALEGALGDPKRPFLAILGGAKVSDKIGVLHRLVEKVDALALGGAMAYTFLASQGVETGRSRVETDKLDDARAILEKAAGRGVKVILPVDHLAAAELKPDAEAAPTEGEAIPADRLGVDIGPKTLLLIQREAARAKTILWNGPLGVFEMPRFAAGTLETAKAFGAAAEAGAMTVAGGGDTLAALKAAKVEHVGHRSTGGGASLEFIEGKLLPGLAALAAPTPSQPR